MDSQDVVDDVNALLKLGVGDSYRLEHIKQAYIQNKTIWITDKNYLEKMREKYLVNHVLKQQAETDENSETDYDDKEMIHCWKCGKKGPLGANFCMACGASLFEVGTETDPEEKPTSSIRSKNQTKTIGWKIPVMVGIPVLVLIILGAGYTQGFFDNVLERSAVADSKVDVADSKVGTVDTGTDSPSTGKTNSKCGAETVFDPVTNSCVLDTGDSTSSGKTNSKCGAETVFDPVTNSCVLDN